MTRRTKKGKGNNSVASLFHLSLFFFSLVLALSTSGRVSPPHCSLSRSPSPRSDPLLCDGAVQKDLPLPQKRG